MRHFRKVIHLTRTWIAEKNNMPIYAVCNRQELLMGDTSKVIYAMKNKRFNQECDVIELVSNRMVVEGFNQSDSFIITNAAYDRHFNERYVVQSFQFQEKGIVACFRNTKTGCMVKGQLDKIIEDEKISHKITIKQSKQIIDCLIESEVTLRLKAK